MGTIALRKQAPWIAATLFVAICSSWWALRSIGRPGIAGHALPITPGLSPPLTPPQATDSSAGEAHGQRRETIAAVQVRVVARGGVSLAGYSLSVASADGQATCAVVGADSTIPLAHGGQFVLSAEGFEPSFVLVEGPAVVELEPIDSFLRVNLSGRPDYLEPIDVWAAEDTRALAAQSIRLRQGRGSACFAIVSSERMRVGARGPGLSAVVGARLTTRQGWATECTLDLDDGCELVLRMVPDAPSSPSLEGRRVTLEYLDSGSRPGGPPSGEVRSVLGHGDCQFVGLRDGLARLCVIPDFGDAILLSEDGLTDTWFTCGGTSPRSASPLGAIAEVVPVGPGFDIDEPYSISLDTLPGIGNTVLGPAIGLEQELLDATHVGLAYPGGQFLVSTGSMQRVSPGHYILPLPIGPGRIVVRSRFEVDYAMRATCEATGARYEAIEEGGTWIFLVPDGNYALEWSWNEGHCQRHAARVAMRTSEEIKLILDPPGQAVTEGYFEAWSSIPVALRPVELQVECDEAQVLEDGSFSLRHLVPLAPLGSIQVEGGRYFPSVVTLARTPEGLIAARLDWQHFCPVHFSVDSLLGGHLSVEIVPAEMKRDDRFDYQRDIAAKGRIVNSSVEVLSECGKQVAGWIVEYAEGRRLFRGWFFSDDAARQVEVEVEGGWGVVGTDSGLDGPVALYIRRAPASGWDSPYVLFCVFEGQEEKVVWLPRDPQDWAAYDVDGGQLSVSRDGDRVRIAR